MGRGEFPFFPVPCQLMTEAAVRTDPESQELSLPPPAATFGKTDPAPQMGNKIVPTLLQRCG